jgi:type VI secretion system protein ImpG
MFNKHYQDELSFLRELGQEFARTYPEAAPFLAEAGTDPDVERLLEGFAFLAGRIRQKIEDEIPEFTHGLMEMLWPHYLRPIPSMATLQFEALPQAAKEPHVVPRGTEVASVPVDGTSCRFRTAYEVRLEPLALEATELRMETPQQLRLKFRLAPGLDAAKAQIRTIRLHLHGEPAVTRALYLCLFHHLERITLRPLEGGAAGKVITLGAGAVKPVGFRPEEGLLPAPARTFDGFLLLAEYFAYPQKFLFADLELERLRELGDARAFEARLELKRLPEPMPSLGSGALVLGATPIVNIFKNDADPIRLDPARIEYRVRPGGTDPAHHEIHSIEEVTGLVKGTAEPRRYEPFFSFAHTPGAEGEGGLFYRSRLEPAVAGEGTDTYISFGGGDDLGGRPGEEIETVSIETLSTNRRLASKLRIGDISAATSSSPSFARFRNITKVTASVPPPLGGGLYWRLLAHLALNYRSLGSAEALRAALGLYNFRALVDRQGELALKQLLDGIKQVSSGPATRLFLGAPLRGIAVQIDVDEDHFAGEGDVYLLAAVLNEFLSLYVSLNAFSQLTVSGIKHGATYRWPARLGTVPIL